jgi:hypothetical protein
MILMPYQTVFTDFLSYQSYTSNVAVSYASEFMQAVCRGITLSHVLERDIKN